ncbi:hypothetical protein AOQ88_02260 [Candidatus Riesia sp. GBBU]|nr:hypothetical protein AOQ88_02190 [Candidatus Riesia sp. GBBU]ARC55045.1 hypothetical protein AOQ88_02260 [Candidatus Riesia sp. GBBU]
MIWKISKLFIDEILTKTNIIDIIKNKISLKKSGKNYKSVCPFHHEKVPSFFVNEEKQFYHCFGCCAHGNVIDFIMNYEKLNFIEAVKELSVFQNMEVIFEKNNEIKKQKNIYEEKLYKIMNEVNSFYAKQLERSEKAREYLNKLGIDKKSICNFSIGFSPSGWNNLAKNFNNKKYTKYLIDLGLIIKNKYGGYYDFFRSRIIFPIRDKIGNLVAFGGRVISSNTPKYLHSSESRIFNKREQLYGIYEIKKKKITVKKLLIVEGYIDVISLSKSNIDYSVAILGTNISVEQIKTLFSLTNTIVFCYDGDKAGYEAGKRSLNKIIPFLTEKRCVKFMFLPNGHDPDSLIRMEGKKNFEERIKYAYPLSKFFFKIFLEKTKKNNEEWKTEFFSLSISMIRRIPDRILKISMINKLGNLIGIPKISYLFLNKNIKTYKFISTQSKKKINNANIKTLISILILNPSFSKLVPNSKKIIFYDTKYSKLFYEIVDLCLSNQKINTSHLLEYYRNNKFIIKLEKFIVWNDIGIEEGTSKKIFLDILKHFLSNEIEKRFNYLMYKSRNYGLNIEEKKEVYQILYNNLKSSKM